MLTVEGTAVKGVVFMNRIFKVIFNRNRQLVQVVPEYAKNRGKEVSESRKGGVRGLAKVLLTFLATLMIASPGYAAETGGGTESGSTGTTTDTVQKLVIVPGDRITVTSATDTTNNTITYTISAKNDGKIETGNTDLVSGGTVYTALNGLQTTIGSLDTGKSYSYITTEKSVSGNLTALDSQVKTNADAIGTNTENITNNTNAISAEAEARKTADTALTGKIGTLDANGNYIQKDASVSSNLSYLDTQVKSNTTDITGLKDLSNITSAGETGIRKQAKKAVQVAATGNATVTTKGSEDDGNTLTYTINVAHNGEIKAGDTNLVSGGTLYTELRPSKGIYVNSSNTTAANLLALDTNLKNVIDAIGLDSDDTTKSYTSKLNKYFKVNPTGTAVTDAAANGTNAVAIGPSAQAGDKSTDATTSTTTITGGTSSTAVGDSAKANGNQSVALGYGSEVLNASGSTTAVSGSTAIGNGAKVEGGSDSTALGSGATVDTASNAMALGKSATINKTATSGVAIGNGAVTGSADQTITVNNLSYNVNAAGGVDSVAIGTDASSAGNTSLALGKGATVENDSDKSYQAVVKSDDIAVGTGAKTTASDASTAIGKSATVSQSTDAMAIGSSATVGASSNDAMALGKGATVGSGATDSIAVGTSAKTISADTIAIGQNTSATGANSVVIGKGATTTSEGGNAIGLSSTASGNSTAIGQSAKANNYNAVAIGNGATANADKSIALGYNAGVGTSEGKGETQNAGSLIAIGTSAGNNVSGMQNVAIGESAGSHVKSSNNIAIGTQAGYGINYASDNKVQNGYNVSIGYKANYQENAADIMYATALGNEANASNYAVAIGDGAKASGTNSLALGYSAQASDAESMALGHNASAADGNVAIGNGSLAPAVSSLGTVKDGYVYQSTTSTDSSSAATTTLTELKSAFTYKPLASDSHYISVGTTDLTRRISNVADGVFASDAATVGQLNSLNELLQATDTKVGLTKDYFEQKFTNLNTTIDASKTHYFSISESSDNLSANKDNTGATSNKADAMAIGPNANATNVKSLAVGNNVYATGLRSIAIGTAPNPTKDAAGTTTTHNTSAEGENSIALGTSTTAQADNSVAIGTRAQAYTTDTDSGKTGARSVAIGNLATTAGNQSVALGYDATVKYNYGTAIGAETLASGNDAVAIGKGSKAYSTDSTAIGQGNSITGNNVYGLGSSNEVSGKWGAVTQSGISGYQNTITSVSDQDTTNALKGIYMTGNANDLNQQNKYNVMEDITVQGSSNKIYGGPNISAGHPNTLSQIAIVGSGNTVQGKSSDDSKTNNIKDVTILGYNNKVDANTDTTVDFSNTQILGSNVTAKLGNSVYLGSNAAYTGQTTAASDAITSARTAADTAAEASDAYKAATTDAAKAQIKAQYEAQYLYQLNVQAMEASGTTAGTQSYSTDETYGDGTRYTYAGSNPTGVITVGKAGSERRIQNVAAGLVSATSTDAVNGSQLYALTRQIRFGGDNSSFGTTTADDKNVVARGSNETLNIIGGEKDSTKLTDNNLGVVSDGKDTLTVKLSKNVNLGNDGSVAAGNTTLDTNGITITNGPKFTSSSIDADSQKITSVKAGEADTDAANVGQVKSARTLLTQGTNTQLADTEANGHHTYVVNVDNLAVKANGTGNTTVELANGINFVNGTNTTAAVGTDGTVTISATHNKLSTVSATTGDTDNVTLTLTDADGHTVTSTGLKNTYTTVTKDGTAHKVTFARNDGITQTVSLGDLDGASKGELATTAAKATSEVTNGTNVTSVTKTTGNNGQNIYTVNVDDLAVKTTSGEKKSVHLADGLVFADGTNTTATVGDNGTIKFNVSDAAIKKQAVQAINVESGSNVTVTPVKNADGTLKTFTVAASDLKYSANGISRTTSLANGISFAAGANTTAEIDNNGAIKINATHNKLNATGTATKATADSNAVTLTLNDQDGNTTTTGLTDTYTTVSKDATNKKVTFKRNDGETQTLELSDLGGITAAQDKYVTGGKVTYNDKGDGTAALTGNNGLAASITGLKDTKVSSGTASYVGTQGNASGSATLTMNDGSKVAITGLKDDYITSAAVGAETNHVTMTRLGGGTVDLNLNPILEKYSLSDYRLVGNGDSQDQAYQVNADGTVTLNVVDAKNTANKRTIQITGLASQSGVNAGRTTVKSSDNSVTVSDSTANSDTHTYDIKVDYSKIPGHVSLSYTGDTGSGSNTLNNSVKFAGTTNQVTTTAKDGQVTFALASDIKGINSVTTGNTTLSTNGVSNGKMSLTGTGMTITDTDASKQVSVTTSGVFMGSQRIQNVANAEVDTDAATLKQVKNARTIVAAGSNVASVKPSEGANNQMTYTVNVDNLSVKANNEAAKSVTLQNGLTFNDGTNTTASVGENGAVSYNLNQEISLTKVTAGSSTLDTSGLIITGGPKVTQNGIDAGSQKITGVANGENAHDAVNKGQLDALQSQVTGGWNLAGKNSDGTAVTAKIGAGKTVTYTDGAYTKSVVTKDDSSGNATVKVDVTTGTLTSGTDGRITSADGLATTGDVANAVNNASWTIQDGNKPQNAQQVKAGDTVSFKAGDNLSLDQNGKVFTYKLDKTLTDMTSVTAVDDKQNKAVFNGEGLKVSDTEGNSLTQHATEIRLHDGTKVATDTATDVVLNKQGLQNGGHTITGVADGTIGENSQDAINGSQFYKLQQTVSNGGWNITGEDTTQSTHIGNDKTVSFKNGTNTTVAVDGLDTGVDVKVNVNTTAISTDAYHKATASGNGLATASDVASAINNAAWNVKKNGETAQQVKAGDTVTFDAGDNIVLKQSDMSFTYGLASDVDINSIRLGGTKDGKENLAGGIYIGEQAGSGANLAKGFYITGLSNTKWDRAAISENSSMAATEGQLKQAIENITKSGDGTGGFGLTADSGAPIMQDLRKTIQIKGDGEGTADGNIKTSNESGVLRIRLNKKLDLTDQGSVTIGSSFLSNGRAQVGSVVVNGSDDTVSGLSNTSWDEATAKADGYKGSTKAATESQLQAVYTQATTTASANEQHIQLGTYDIVTKTDGNGKKQNSVTMKIVDGSGNEKGQVVINDVAKASDLGDTTALDSDIQNKNGSTSVVDAVNNLNGKVGDNQYLDVTGKEIQNGDSSTTAIGKLNNRMNDIYSKATQHSTVTRADDNVTIQTSTNADGGTNYQIGLNKEKIDLGKVTIQGNEGSLTAKTVTADAFNSGNTAVSNEGVKIGDKTALTSDSLKVGNKTYISSDGLNANSQKITNVQAGTADTDAANVGQVREADEQLAGGIAQNARNISQLGREVDKLDSRIDRVGAGAAALAALHPGAYDPNDKVDFSAGYGNYRGASAAAVGMYYHPDERTILSMGVAMGGGENMVNAGVTWKLGRRTPAAPQPVPVKAAPGAPALVPVSTAAAAPVRPVETAPAVRPVAVRTSVRSVETVAPVAPAARVRPVQPAVAPVRTADTNAQLMELLARQTAILEKLSEQKAVPAAAPAASGDDLFTDVPENHWAYECALKMEKAGVLKGLGGLQVEGNPLLTRKDFARILYTALKNGATTNPALNRDNSLNRMASEFRGELKMVKG